MSFPRYAKYKDSGSTWMGEVPAHWEVGPLKRYWNVTDCKHVTAEFVDDGVPIVSIREVQGRWVNLENAKRTTRHFYDLLVDGDRKPIVGDLIFSRNATVGEVAQVPGDAPDFAMGQDVVLLRRQTAESSPDYLQHVIRSRLVTDQLALLMIGSTFLRINVEEIRGLLIPWAPASEQRSIAAFLDRETATIDALVAEQQRLIELLKEKRQAVISRAITKGLNPAAPMKDSGIDGLGQIPAHWKINRLKHLLAESPKNGISPEIDPTGTTPTFSTAAVCDGVVNVHAYLKYVTIPVDQARPFLLAEGDVLVLRGSGSKDNVGRAGIVESRPPDGCVYPDILIRLRPNERLSLHFLVAFMSSSLARAQIEADAQTAAGIWKISGGSLRELVVTSPPVDEQQHICAYLERVTRELAELVDQAARGIELLQERRAALITAAVTGQIDVRAAAARSAA